MNIFDEHRLALAGARECGEYLEKAEARIAQLEAALRKVLFECSTIEDAARIAREALPVETPLKDGKPLDEYIAECEKDPRKKALLDKARAKLRSASETKGDQT
jgi:hypothetical protein